MDSEEQNKVTSKNKEQVTTEVDAKSFLEACLGECVVRGDATMPVEKWSDTYNMNHPKRGKAVIFSHQTFENQESRLGCEVDEQNLEKCFNSNGFEVVVHRDLKLTKFMQILNELREEDHTDSDCLVIVVMSHGDKNKISCSDFEYEPEVLWDSFTSDRCPSLAGKPKIFLIQACRGDQVDAGTKLMAKRTETDSRPQHEKSYVVPNRADFLIVFSTAPGHYSFRSPAYGSWFFQALIKVLELYKGKKDLLSMMTIVSRVVALSFESRTNDPMLDQKKQVPMINSTLIREIYL